MKQNFFVCFTLLLFGTVTALGQTDRWSTNAPKFAGPELPESPAQHEPWQSGKTGLPTNLVSSVNFLFSAGMADPRAGL